MGKVLIIGIDGLGYKRLRKLLDRGKLPFLESIEERGFCSPLESTIPPVTAPAWTSFITGVEPEKHGIYGFFDSKRNIYFSDDIKNPRFWDFVDSRVIINVPMTYPPDTKIMISGLVSTSRITPSKEEYEKIMMPKELSHILEDVKYELGIGESANFNEYKNLTFIQTEVLELLLNTFRWEIGCIVYGGFDRITHNKKLMKRGIFRKGEKYLDIYLEYLDEVLESRIGRGSKIWNKADHIVLLSDHGEQEVRKKFYINELLERNGFSKFNRDGVIDVNSDVVFYGENHSPFGLLKLNNGSIKNKIIKTLKEQNVVKGVMTKEEIYGGSPYGDAPDLIFEMKDCVAKGGMSNDIVKNNPSIEHSMEGFLLMTGKKFKVKNPRIIDVPATVLGSLGKGVELDGRLLCC